MRRAEEGEYHAAVRDLEFRRVERRPADGASQRFQQCVERQHELHGRARGQEGDEASGAERSG